MGNRRSRQACLTGPAVVTPALVGRGCPPFQQVNAQPQCPPPCPPPCGGGFGGGFGGAPMGGGFGGGCGGGFY